MSDSSDLLKPFFYEQSINGKVYRIYTVNSIGLLNLTSNEALCDVIKIIDIVKKGDINTLILLLSDKNWRTQIFNVNQTQYVINSQPALSVSQNTA